MRQIRVGTAQFEPRDADKDFNLGRIDALAGDAAAKGAEIVAFHECSISGYTFLERLERDEIEDLAEPVPGPSTERLVGIAGRRGLAVAAGLVEADRDKLYNTYVVATGDGVVAKFRKLHAFISPHIACGDGYVVFDLLGCRFGILICYDCNLPENMRMTALLGAEIVLAPHVTGCLPSPMPGRGTVAPEVWRNRDLDPARCRQEFDGPKGRGWLHRWLPARAFENGVYLVYSNPIGDESGTIKPGGSMVLDPYGEVLAECRELGDQVVTATLDPAKREQASGPGYIRSRRPELYGKMLETNPALGPDRKPEVWWQKNRKS